LKKKLTTVVLLLLLVAAGCGSTAHSSAPPSPAGQSANTFTVGVLTDLTGEAASVDSTTLQGIKAGVGMAGQEGYHIHYVIADGQTSPTGALTAAQRLVEQDHVDAVISLSSLTFAAAPYLTAHGIPVVGADEDGSEWATSPNMFSFAGIINYAEVFSTAGQMLKKLGATSFGGLGYGISPSSAKATAGDALSAKAAGLQVGYTNANFPFGSTNVDPVALQMVSHGVDGVILNVVPSTGFALVRSLDQRGAKIKAALLLTGYGGDLLNSGAPTIQAAQGDYFATGFEPIEEHTAATEKFQQAMAKYAGVTNDPTFIEYGSYVAVDALVQGLKKAGPSPTKPSLIKALGSVTGYNAAGLYGGSFSVNFGQRTAPDTQCLWVTHLEGSTFELVPGLEPICGKLIPNLKV
jgi:branched-chain amino acid transport system substrate-binding protein